MDDQDIIRWRTWCVGGKVYNGSTFDEWSQLPDDGVLTVMLWHRDGTRRVMQGNDYYWATPDGVYAHGDSRDPVVDIINRYPSASVKRGMWTTDAEMNRVAAEALEG
jgi:hypothetical protein